MKYKLVKLQRLSGNEASIYSVYLEHENRTLFERFIAENQPAYQQELWNIIGRIKSMGTEVGARDHFFKKNEGKPGDLVCALYDEPDKYLRLYCIRFGRTCIILGGGGPKDVAAWQDDSKLAEEANWMITVSNDIYKRILEGDIRWVDDGFELEGDLSFNQDEE
ncbi:MAG: hypothetical protein JNK20_02615 [Flavipsychrobacter sp.]|nr:hypothetical protein [Flavipsychrobacter sp.]